MGFWQLYVFINVVELKSFSKAAAVCNLSQPTVSSHIKQLESNFDCILIDRIGRQAVVTKVGKILYGYAKKLTSMKSEAESAISAFQGNLKGEIIVGGSTIPGIYILPGILAKFREPHPSIRVSLEIDSSEVIMQGIIKGDIEIGIVGLKSNHQWICQSEIISDEMVLAIPPDHRWGKRETISIEALKREPFIKREDGSGTWKSFSKSMAQAGYSVDDLNIVAEVRHTNGVVSGIKNNLGVSVLSPIAITDDLANKRLKILKIKSVDLKRNFFLSWNSKLSGSPISALLGEFIKESFK